MKDTTNRIQYKVFDDFVNDPSERSKIKSALANLELKAEALELWFRNGLLAPAREFKILWLFIALALVSEFIGTLIETRNPNIVSTMLFLYAFADKLNGIAFRWKMTTWKPEMLSMEAEYREIQSKLLGGATGFRFNIEKIKQTVKEWRKKNNKDGMSKDDRIQLYVSENGDYVFPNELRTFQMFDCEPGNVKIEITRHSDKILTTAYLVVGFHDDASVGYWPDTEFIAEELYPINLFQDE